MCHFTFWLYLNPSYFAPIGVVTVNGSEGSKLIALIAYIRSLVILFILVTDTLLFHQQDSQSVSIKHKFVSFCIVISQDGMDTLDLVCRWQHVDVIRYFFFDRCI